MKDMWIKYEDKDEKKKRKENILTDNVNQEDENQK